MLERIIKYGIAAGLIAGITLSVITLTMQHDVPSEIGMAIGYATMLVAFSMIFVAIKRQRDLAGGGVIKFLPALGMGLAISLIAGLFYVAAWEASLAISGSDFIGEYTASELARKQASGASAAEVAAFKAEMDSMVQAYANPILRFLMTLAEILPVGVIVSLVSAALLCNPRFLPLRRDDMGAAA